MAAGDFLTWAVQAQDAPAHVARILQTILLNEGVVDVAGGSFETTEDTGSNMNITVGSGTLGDLAVVEGDDTAGQGVYVIEAQNATVTKTIAASDPSDDRIDLVVLQNYDDEADSSGSNDAEVEVIEGTPAGSPSAPSLPDSAIPLAEVLVGAGVTAITDANITDTRAEAKRSGELVESVYFTASGTFDKADYPWLRKVRVQVVGGGGAGGGAGSTGAGEASAGAGGGGGGAAWVEVAVSDLSTSETVTVGSGGAGQTAAAGLAGDSSSFGAHAVASGGSGGGAMAGASTAAAIDGGAGGAGSTGDLQVSGGAGANGFRLPPNSGRGGAGGSSVLGGGAVSGGNTASGVAGGDYGGGGSGAHNAESSGTKTGGAGGDGVVVVDLYA